MKILSSYFLLFIAISTLRATWFDDIPRTITQPSGETIFCFVTGDQYARRLHDINDFTIVLDVEDGYYYYADKGPDGGLIPTDLRAELGDPQSIGLEPGYSVSQEIYNRNKEFYQNSQMVQGRRDAPSSGEIAQINVFIRFADDPDFPFDRAYYDAVFQTEEDEPSLRHYFWDVSYNSLLVNTFHYPGTFDGSNTSYVDEYNRSYYEPYSNANPDGYEDATERAQREHTLLANAVNSITSSVSPLIDVDADDDGFVDAVSFVIYGTPGDWADLLWPHRWALYSQEVFINGSQVYDYLFMLSESWYYNVGVLCHEFGHVLGAPDYYHYSGGGAPTPVGGWDVMASNGNPPQFPSAFTKWKYFDWIELEELTQSGTYTLNPLQDQDNTVYKIPSPNSETEYFILEYRKQEGMYDVNAPGPRSGLVAYRINTEAGNGNAQGPPDELYVYRPGGDLNNTGNFDQAPYSADYGHTELNDDTDPSCFLYNNGNGSQGGLNLYNVSNSGDFISFTVSFGSPIISVDPSSLNFDLNAGEYEAQTLTISNIGEPETVLNYEIVVSSSGSYLNPQGGPDGGNYYWTTSADEPDMSFEWIDIEDEATQLTFSGNDQFSSQQISLPFDFQFFSETYNYLQVNANGWVGWSSDNETVWENGEIPSASMPFPAIFGFFDDLNPNNDNGNENSSGDIYYHTNDDRVVVWFDDVVRWEGTAGSGTYNFQIVLYSDGTFRCNYDQMTGTTDQSTIGWQNQNGQQGTQVSPVGEGFVSNNFSWEAKTYSSEIIPWLSLSSDNGSLDGAIYGDQSTSIYVQATTLGLEQGDYFASINVVSPTADPVAVPITLTVTGDNTTPTLPYIDISTNDDGIVDLPDNVDPLFSAVATRYTHIVAPNEDLIQILIQDDFTDEQILHARRVLESYLVDIPGSEWGSNKAPIANAIATTNAILFLLNDETEYDNPDLWELIDSGVQGQDLLATEVHPEGSSAYMNSSQRDATYEEVLHYVHGYGIQLVAPGMQNAIESAMSEAIENEYYEPLSDLPVEDYDEEYLAMGLECYFGLWEHDPSGDGYCGDHEYAFIDRETMASGDPELYNIIQGFFGGTWEYTASLSATFSNDFHLSLQNNLNYTFRSQYLTDITLNGDAAINIYGNNYDNNFQGNTGDNIFLGSMGDDVIYGSEGVDRAVYTGVRDEYVIIPPYATDDSSYQIIDLEPGRDGTDHLFDIEEVELNGTVFSLYELLGLDVDQIPNNFALHNPYPNPFNPRTRITYSVAAYGKVELSIFDLSGRLIRTLRNAPMGVGNHEVEWDAKDNEGNQVSTGVYLIHFASGSFKGTQKVLLLK